MQQISEAADGTRAVPATIEMKRHRYQFGLLALSVFITIAAALFAILRPAAFPSDDMIRKDLGIPKSIAINVFDRQTISKPDGANMYWATVHVVDKPHRLVRISCYVNESLAEREKWAPYTIIDHLSGGLVDFRTCEQFYGNAPTEKEIDEFRQLVLNFN